MPGGPADDDPLTSPSFPAINAADSRSYRTRRSASQPGIQDASRYPAGPDHISRPDGYPVQSPAPQPAGQDPLVSSPRTPSASPAANPYGSYLSAPSAYQQPGYPDPAAASHAGADYPGYPTPEMPAGNGYYPAVAADGYLPAAGLDAAAPATGRHAHNGSTARGYTEIDYSSLRYDDPVYPDSEASGLVGYAAPAPGRQYEQRGFDGSELGYGQDGYQDYSGYRTGGR